MCVDFLKNDVYCGTVFAKLKDVRIDSIQDSFVLYYSRKIDFSNILPTKTKQEISNIMIANVKAANITEDNMAVQQIVFKKKRFFMFSG